MSCDDPSVLNMRQSQARILDANANRAAEGLRVVEEYCRFVLDDAHLSRICKTVRHGLTNTLLKVGWEQRASARDTLGDVGIIPTDRGTPADRANAGGEAAVFSLEQIAAANSERVKQALRAIEEYLKLSSAEAAARVESLRYQWYTLEKALIITATSQQRLVNAKLYVLIDGGTSESAFAARLHALLAGGVQVLQLRDKGLEDRQLLERARLMRRVIDEATHRPLLIMNDRPDLAVLCRADGVHVGQAELTIRDVRQIVGPQMLVGVSTHSIEQARQAVLDGANYIGCGPTFPSETKHFAQFPGLDYLRAVASEIALPAFAIGGITLENLSAVLATGFFRVALSKAIAVSGNPGQETASFLTALQGRA
jgi:thiamine-phosphate pyrophosphorylase